MLTELKGRMNELNKKCKKETNILKKPTRAEEYIKKNMKNTLKGINSRLEDAQQINNLEYRVVEITQAEQQKQKKRT